MAFRSWLIHTCAIQAFTTSRGATGELAKTWATKTGLAAVDCRFIVQSETVANESIGQMVLTTYKILFPAGTNVANIDRISDVRLKTGNTLVDAGPFQIEQVLPRNAKRERHISLMLEKVKGNE